MGAGHPNREARGHPGRPAATDVDARYAGAPACMRQHRPFYGSPLRMVSPGERIEAGWFDGELVTRDYFVARADDQSC